MATIECIIQRAVDLQKPTQAIDQLISAAAGVSAVASLLRDGFEDGEHGQRVRRDLEGSLIVLAGAINSNTNEVARVLLDLSDIAD